MNIIVCIKLVPSVMNLTMDQEYVMQRDRVVQVINPADEAALEAALRLKGNGSVTVITMGKPSGDDELRSLLARGVDRAVLITDKAFAGADTYATARTLSVAVNSLGNNLEDFDLILCGRRAIDGETGQVPPELAILLKLPFVTNITKINFNQGKIVCSRRLEEGIEELELGTPAILSLCEYSYPLRLATILGLQKARRMQIITLSREMLGLKKEECGLKGSPTRVRRITGQPQGIRNVTIAKNIDEGIARLSELIAEVPL
ncbi:MAG: Electron transfer flavoprotein alpha/beta-subunit [Herbinix sp.]|nr:Electron transfer flavoprotein alpha/beta-subunit [Herbinix sp.]